MCKKTITLRIFVWVYEIFRLHFVSLRMTKNLVLKNKTLGLCPNTQQVFSCSEILFGQEFSYEQVHKFPLEMASPPPYILAVCFENCLRQRRFLRRSQQNGCAAASIFTVYKRFDLNFDKSQREGVRQIIIYILFIKYILHIKLIIQLIIIANNMPYFHNFFILCQKHIYNTCLV